MQNNTFSFKRLSFLLRRELAANSKSSWIIVLAAFVIFYLSTLSNVNNGIGLDSSSSSMLTILKILLWQFTPSLMVSGFILSSIAFLELGNSAKKQAYLSIPASHLEKWASKWLLTAIIYPIAFLLFFQLFAQLCYWTVYYSFGVHLVTFSLFDPLIWQMIGIYILTQSLFLLASVSMPRFSIFKMIAILFGLAFLIMIFVNIGFFFSQPSFGLYNFDFVNGPQWGANYRIRPNENDFWESDSSLKVFLLVCYLVVLPIVLFISYLKLTEKEV